MVQSFLRTTLLLFLVIFFTFLLFILPPAVYLKFLGVEIHFLFGVVYLIFLLISMSLFIFSTRTPRVIKWVLYSGMVSGYYACIFLAVSSVFLRLTSINILGCLPLFVALVGLYGMLNARTIAVKRISISSKKLKEHHLLAFISDVHLGSRSVAQLKKIIDIIGNHPIHALLIGGDLIDSHSFKVSDLGFLKGLNVPIIMVTGNHEHYLKNINQIIKDMKSMGIQVIDGDIIRVNGIEVLGIGDNQSKKEQFEGLDQFNVSKGFRICLIHKPWLWPAIGSKSDLMLSGHTHKGQLFPFHWLVRLQFPTYYGFHQINGSHAYISSGAGCWGPNVRIGSSNEVVLIELHPD